MALTTQERTNIIKLVVAMFNAAPGATYLSELTTVFEANGRSLSGLAKDLSNTTAFKALNPVFQTASEFAADFLTPLGLQANQEAIDFITAKFNAGVSKGQIAFDAASALNASTSPTFADAKAILNNKTAVAEYYSVTKEIAQLNVGSLQQVISSVTKDVASVAAAQTAIDNAAAAGNTFTLTAGVDSGAAFTGGAGNDTFTGNTAAGVMGLTSLDSIDGGAGTDTLNINTISALDTTAAQSAVVKNIETAAFASASNITANTTGYTGLTSLTTASVGDSIVTAATTTNTTVAATGLQAGAGLAGNDLTVNGANNLTTTSTASFTGGTSAQSAIISIGATTAAKGDVSVTHTETTVDNATAGASTSATSTITVTGGKTVTVNSLVTAGTAENVGDIATVGAIAVNGNADTTAVTVTQSAATEAFGTPAANNKIKITNGAVTIADTNLATVSDTLTTVTLNNFGASTIASNVLSTVNVKGGATATTASGSLGLNTTATDTSVVATTLALNGAGGFVGAISGSQADKYTTVNVTSTAATTIGNVTFAAATALNFSGAAITTLTANSGIGLVTAITSTGGGVTLGTALATGVAFTGGAGAETISVGATTKAIAMGDGNDTVTFGAAIVSATGSVAGGLGTDTMVMTDTLAQDLSVSSVFNSKVSGFEILSLTNGAGNKAIDLTALNNVNKVSAIGLTGLTINGMASGGTLTLTGASTSETINITGAAGGVSDVLNLGLAKVTAGVVAYGTVTAANVETINITSNDQVAAGSAAAIDTLILAATGATSVVVTGNNGLTLTNTNNALITNFDASGVVANGAATVDTAANLAVTFASANTTATANVSIKGGAGNDVLTGSIAKDTIDGGAGADYLYGDNQGTKEIQYVEVSGTVAGNAGNAGNVVINGITVSFTEGATNNLTAAAMQAAIAANSSLKGLVTATVFTDTVTITALTDGDLVQVAQSASPTLQTTTSTTTAGTAGATAVDTINGGAGNDVIVGGGGADMLTGGAGADTFFMLKGHSVLASMATITDYTFAAGGTSNDKIILGDVTTLIGTMTTVQDLSTSVSIQAAMDAAATTNLVNNGLSVFTWGGNEYAFVEASGAGTSYVISDFVVKLTGLPLASGATIAGTGFDAV